MVGQRTVRESSSGKIVLTGSSQSLIKMANHTGQ